MSKDNASGLSRQKKTPTEIADERLAIKVAKHFDGRKSEDLSNFYRGVCQLMDLDPTIHFKGVSCK